MWYNYANCPITVGGNPIGFDDSGFENLFVRTKPFERLESYLEKIQNQKGTFWVYSPGSGYGKSTVLNFIARYLYRELNNLRMLPLHIQVTGGHLGFEAVYEFQMGLVNEIWDLSPRLGKMSNVLGVNYDKDIVKLIDELKETTKEGQGKLSAERPWRYSREDTAKYFDKAFTLLSNEVVKIGRFKGYVLLVDEIDKLSDEEMTKFLGRSQKLFEQLYAKANCIVFFAGQQSFVDRVHEGPEYTYYRGERFPLAQFIDLEDVKKLIESRILPAAGIRQPDTPWTMEAYDSLRELTNGVPREMIRNAAEILNMAYEEKLNQIGKGFVKEVIQKNRANTSKIAEYLQKSQKLYAKLKKICESESDSFSLIPIFYSLEAGIAIELDSKMQERTRLTGVEDSDEKWSSKIQDLVRAECIIVDRDHDRRRLEPKGKEFIYFVKEKLEMDASYIPGVLKELRIEFPKGKIEEPDFMDAIGRPFRNALDPWLTTEDIFRWFMDDGNVHYYLADKYHDEDFQSRGRKIFDNKFAEFKKSSSLLVIREDNKDYYRLIPNTLNEEDLIGLIQKYASRAIANTIIETTAEKSSTSTKDYLVECDELIERLVGKLFERKKALAPKPSYMRDELSRNEVLGTAGLDEDTLYHIETYIRESERPTLIIQLLRALVIAIFRDMCRLYENQPLHPAPTASFQYELVVHELLRSFDERKIEGKEIGLVRSIELHKYDWVGKSKVRVGETQKELDLVAYRKQQNRKHYLLGSVKTGKAKMYDINDFLRTADQFMALEKKSAQEHCEDIPSLDGRWFVCGETAVDIFNEALKRDTLVLDKSKVNILRKKFGLPAIF